MNLNRIFSLFLLLLATGGLLAQEGSVPSSDKEIEEAYERRIKKEYLNRIYIPKDLTDCFIQLNKLIEGPSKEKFKTAPEEVVVQKLHFSLGRWMIVNWGFYGGSRLSHFLKELGIHYPDDMARFIIITYHRNLNRSELKVKDLVERFQADRKEAFEAEKAEGEVIHEEKRIRPRPEEDQ